MMEDEGMMDMRETVARAIAGIYWKNRQDVDDRWEKWLPEADAAIAALSDAPEADTEAWRIAQLAVGLLGNRIALDGRQENIWNRLAVVQAREILAESRRQAAVPAGERDDG